MSNKFENIRTSFCRLHLDVVKNVFDKQEVAREVYVKDYIIDDSFFMFVIHLEIKFKIKKSRSNFKYER